MNLALWVVAGMLVFLGVLGTVLPALPGATLVLAGLAVAAWADGFHKVGPWTLGGLAVLTLVSYAVDLAASALGARRVGASGMAILGAIVGTLVGIFFGLPGLLLGPFMGATSGELLHRRDWRHAGRVGFGTALGLAFGLIAKLAIVFAMLGLFIAVYLLGTTP